MSVLKFEAIAAIRTNLEDRYKDELAIIKELIQNADDAGATCLHVGWVGELSHQATHPLLNGPAIFVLNNGEFTDKDADAISWMGLNYKSADNSSIGKFGYGLKSIFHLCEAFFYLASGEEQTTVGAKTINRRDILCPWFGNFEKYPNKGWDTFPLEAQKDIEACLQELIANEIKDSQHWFCLWIPLRQKSHSTDWHSIIDKYPGDDATLPKLINTLGREIELANILPLLTNLNTIKFWKKECLDSSVEMLFELQVKAEARRRKLDNSILKGNLLNLTGSISLQIGSTNSQEMTFSGYETCLDIVVEEFQNKQGWPQSGTIDPNTGAYEQVKTKAIPHCAVCFFTNPTATKKKVLSITYAVFLPLQEGESIAEINESKYSILLHGYFFVDAGRSRIKLVNSSDEEAADMQSSWNLKLLEEGTLTLLLPALKDFVEKANLTIDDTRSLTEAIKKSKLFSDRKTAICAKSYWLYCITIDGGSWQLVDTKAIFYELPATSQENLHCQVFPTLKKIIRAIKQRKFTFVDKQRLCVSKPEKWPVDLLNQMFTGLDVYQIFDNTLHLNYLIEFLESALDAATFTAEIRKKLLNIAKTALLEVSFSKLQENHDLFNKFLEFVPQEKCLFIKIEEEEILKDLLKLNLNLLIIPLAILSKDKQQDKQKDDKKTLLLSDTKKILELLERYTRNRHSEKFTNTVSRLVLEFSHLAENQYSIWQECGKLRVFRGYDHFYKKETYFSYQEMLIIKSKNTLMLNTYLSTDIEKLQQVLAEHHVVEIANNVAELLFKNEIKPFSLQICLQAIRIKPKLINKVENRANLLISLLRKLDLDNENNLDSEDKKALRYLLHNSLNNYESNEKLIIQEDTPLGKVVAKAIQNEHWRFVQTSITDKLSLENCHLLGILAASNPIILEIVTSRITPEISSQINSVLDNNEVNTLLRDIHNEQLWKILPIHTNQKCQRVQINSKTYLKLNSQFDLDETIDIIIIEKHNDARIAAKQMQWIEKLDAIGIIKICLQNRPTDHYKTILHALDYIYKDDDPSKLKDELMVNLKKEQWLPTKDGRYIKPEDIVYIKGLETEVDEIVLTSNSPYTTPSSLKDDIWPQFEHSLINLFPQNKDAIAVLGLMMAEDDRYSIGKVEIKDVSELREFFIAFNNVLPNVSTTWPILETLSKSIGFDNSLLLIKEGVNKLISCDQICKILNYLSKGEENVKNLSNTYLKIHNLYLKTLIEHSNFDMKYLSHISLLNKNKKWSSPDGLCVGFPGIANEYLIEEEQETLIKPLVKIQNNQNNNKMPINAEIVTAKDNDDLDKSSERLKEYFRGWENKVASEVIGSFLYFLSSDPKIRTLASYYLGNRHIDMNSIQMNWAPPRPRKLLLRGLSDTDYAEFTEYNDIHEAARKNLFTIEVLEGDKIDVISITGKRFKAEISQEVLQLFIGNPAFRKQTRDFKIWCLKIRKLSPLKLEAIKNNKTIPLSQILLKSTQQIFSTVYNQNNPRLNTSLEEIWKEFEKSEQLDIQVAQNLILESAFFYFSQLGLTQLKSLKDIQKKWQDNRYQIEESLLIPNSQHDILLKKKEAIRNELKGLLTNHSKIQSELVLAISNKLKANQYRIDSIPFELFQNADDSLVELEELRQEKDQYEDYAFSISSDEKGIAFLHWGRRINQFRAGSGFNGKDRGFDRDLEKMLIMASSDKSLAETQNISVTGKFGLGFKSVFLATDRPKIISGLLSFEVLGGLYPNTLNEKTVGQLQEQLKKYCPPNSTPPNGTIIYLPTKPEIITELLERFKKLIPVLLIFARKIRRCQLPNGQNDAWSEQLLMNRPHIRVGILRFDEKPIKALLLRTNSCTLLLAIGAEGIGKLPVDIPPIWVTAPTRETASFGFAINASFAIDVGRAQLADVAANIEVAYKLGSQIGAALCEMYGAAQENWQLFSKTIGLAPNTTEYMFWQSLWTIFTDCFKSDKAIEDKTTKVLSLILWGGRDCGMAKLLYNHPVLPNGLFESYRKLISLHNISSAISGLLDKKESFLAASEWESFSENIVIEKTISITHIYDIFIQIIKVTDSAGTRDQLDGLKGIAHEIINSKRIDLSILLEKEFQNIQIDPIRADKFGKLITQQFFLDTIDNKHAIEYIRIQNTIRVAKFLQHNKGYKSAEDLLVKDSSEGNTDEAIRAAFAPGEYLLSSNYTGNALLFFKACRQKLQAPAQRLCEWGKKADQKEKQRAFLLYLLNGELREQVVLLLKDNLSDWLRELSTWDLQNLYSPPFSSKESSIILLGLDLISPDNFHVNKSRTFAPSTLENIYNWWKKDHQNYLKKYNKSVYPENYFPRFIKDEFTPNNLKERQDWTHLFFLGAMQTIGRTTPEHHRSFLTHKLVKQFIETPKNTQAIFNSLESYLDSLIQDIPFFLWLRQFVSFYIISRWLDDYIGVFLDIDKDKNFSSLDSLLSPRTNTSLQGTGMGDCPPITRVLGIGACFVVRELIRNKIINNKAAYKYCYVPSRKVRHLLMHLGCEDLENQNARPWEISQRIYQFIKNHSQEDATFDLCFDIPLSYIAEDKNLQEQILGTHLDDYKEIVEEY